MSQSALLWLLSGVMTGDLLIPYLLAPFYPGYCHKTMVMSVLGSSGSPVRLLYSGWLVLGGVGFGAGALALWQALRLYTAGPAGAALGLLLAYALGGMVLAGLFPVGESKESHCLSARIHGAGAALGFLALLGAGLPLSLACFQVGRTGEGILCLLLFGLGIAVFTLFVLSDKEQFAGSWVDREGSWQRLSLLLMYLPPALLALGALGLT